MHKSCLGCYYEHERKCYWFDIVGGDIPKQIPNNVFDKGCGKYMNNVSNGKKTGDKLVDKIIEVFDGEIISNKYEPSVNYKPYKKKWVKSSHNYSHRKDAQ